MQKNSQEQSKNITEHDAQDGTTVGIIALVCSVLGIVLFKMLSYPYSGLSTVAFFSLGTVTAMVGLGKSKMVKNQKGITLGAVALVIIVGSLALSDILRVTATMAIKGYLI